MATFFLADPSMPTHYRLTVSVMPPNVDVWSWVKWFRNTTLVPKPVKTLGPPPTPKKSPKTTTEAIEEAPPVPSPPPPSPPKDVPSGETPVFNQKHLLRY